MHAFVLPPLLFTCSVCAPAESTDGCVPKVNRHQRRAEKDMVVVVVSYNTDGKESHQLVPRWF